MSHPWPSSLGDSPSPLWSPFLSQSEPLSCSDVEPFQQFCVVVFVEVCVVVQRGANAGVAEPSLDLLGVPPVGDEDRGAAIA